MASSKQSPICAACSKPYTNATMLDCVHSFCRNCVLTLIEKSNVDKIFCPACDTPSKVPSNGVDGFAKSIHLDNEVKVTSIRMKDDLKCQHCKRKKDNEAVEFCQQCFHLLCKTCVENHQLEVAYEKHKRMSIEKFKSSKVKIELPIRYCMIHEEEKIKWYCGDHKELLCETCKNDDHKECFANIFGLQKAAGMEKEDLGKDTPQLEKDSEELDEVAAVNKDMRKKVEVSRANTIKKIEESYDRLKDALDKRKEYLLNECDKIAEGKENVLTDQLNEAKKLKKAYVFLQEQIHDATNKQSLEELLSVKEVMKKRAQVVVEEFRVTNWLLKENEVFDLSCDDLDTIAANISSLGFFSEVPDPTKCTVEGLSLSDAIVDVNREFKVIFRNEKDEMIKGEAMFQYKIEVEEGALKPELQITPTNGMTTLAIKPRSLGQLTLTIMVRNIPLKKFPFVMTVRQPRDYTALPADPKPLNLQSAANNIAINGDQLYVASQNSIEVITTDDTPAEAHKELDLNNPFGVTVIEDEVYVVNRQTQKVHVFKAGNLERTFGESGSGNGQLNNACGICSDGYDRILVADCNNQRVQIFKRIKEGDTTKEEFFCSIPCPSANPVDVAVDASGKVYVTLQSTNQIQVFSWNGNDYQSLENEKHNIGVQPWGIFVDVVGNRFVIDSHNGYLCIFDNTWKPVHSIQSGRYCGRVVLDSNGSIYLNVSNTAQIHKI